MGTRFEQQMLLEADERPGRYRVDVDEAWNCPIVPHGGLVTAIAAKAMATELDAPEQPLRSITSVFAAQVKPGPATIDVTVMRRGRSISQLTATVRNDGEDAGLTAMAVFGAPRPGFDFVDLEPPTGLRPPLECEDWRDRPNPVRDAFPFNFWEHATSLLARGHFPDEVYEPDGSERVYWYRWNEPPVDDDGYWDPLAILALGDTMPGAVGEKTGPTDHPIWLPPSCDFTVHLFGTTQAEWIIGRNRARWAGEGYASVDMELWDPDGRLLAYATQVMFLVFPMGTTPPPAPAR
ncbi:MAG TPA: thioesterase family protein [Acidimicrobiales bacterium]|nr:thioesterase family protein [Acidimicrobiales bacterium]